VTFHNTFDQISSVNRYKVSSDVIRCRRWTAGRLISSPFLVYSSTVHMFKHWLPVVCRITLKLASVRYHIVSTHQPTHLIGLLHSYDIPICLDDTFPNNVLFCLCVNVIRYKLNSASTQRVGSRFIKEKWTSIINELAKEKCYCSTANIYYRKLTSQFIRNVSSITTLTYYKWPVA